MSKGLEAFRDILGIFCAVSGYEVDMNSERIQTVKKELERLEAIDNANPSKALECLNKIVESFNETTTGMYGLGEVVVANDLIYSFKKELDTIKQALLKAQEQERVLEIIKKYIYYSEKSHCIRMREITKSIYNFDYEELKEMLENE